MKRAWIALPAALLALAWWLWPAPLRSPVVAPPAPAAPPEAVPGVAATAGAADTPPQPAAPSAAAPQPPPLPQHLIRTTSLAAVLDELLQRAESGDVAAMQELGRRLNRCSANVLRHGHADIEDRKANLAQAYVGNPEDFRANLRRGLEEDQRRLDECKAVPEPLRSSGVDWLEKAAATGSGTAQLVYVQEALYEFTLLDEHQAVAQIDEFLRRRDLARRFLAEAMTHCVPDALRTQLDFGKYLFERKDPRDYAINRAAAADALLREYRAQGAMAVAVENMQGEFDYLAKELDAPARAAAQRRGEAMFNTCAPR
ncbi:hypothetical protein [Tahibacter harae]|uniref:Uncharacterized protein n=1 Tax=Tahibacter harae TaxID=2963937 RepID=A0ABT1QLJ4_9GAMM|nr:hypothetical protein [Tahibacter harae]MCQ4163394.1 hypothetical protein [Tahibacter harae]